MNEITMSAALNAARKEFLQTIAASERLVVHRPPEDIVIQPLISVMPSTNGTAQKYDAYKTVAEDLNSRIPGVILVEDHADGRVSFSLNLKKVISVHALEAQLIAPLRAHFPTQSGHGGRRS